MLWQMSIDSSESTDATKTHLQVVDPKEIFPGTRVVDKPLTEDQERKALH